MKYLGQLLLWIGFLSGSLATVYHLPADGVRYAKGLKPAEELRFEIPDMSDVVVGEDGWHLIPWAWFSISAAVCMVCAALIRVSLVSPATVSDDTHKDLDEMRYNLSSLIEHTNQLGNEIPNMAPSKITKFVDDVLADDFRSFAENRESIIPKFGLTVYADIMTNFAAGERYVNRAWSAAADGYVDEAANCIDHANTLLTGALSELDQAENLQR